MRAWLKRLRTSHANHGEQSWSGAICPEMKGDHQCFKDRNHGYRHTCARVHTEGKTCTFRWAA